MAIIDTTQNLDLAQALLGTASEPIRLFIRYPVQRGYRNGRSINAGVRDTFGTHVTTM